MKNVTVLGTVAFASVVLMMLYAGAATAASPISPIAAAGAQVDRVVGNDSPKPVQLVRGGYYRGGYRGARVYGRGYRAGNFRGYRFAHPRPYRVYRPYRPFFYGGIAVPYGYGLYSDNGCYWNGYRWVCVDGY